MQMIETKRAIDGCGMMNVDDLHNLIDLAYYRGQRDAGMNLDNLRQDTTGMSTEEHDMSRERRRVMIGTHDDGTPIYKNIQASSAQEMNERIVREYIDSGLIYKMMGGQRKAENQQRIPFSHYAEKYIAKVREERTTSTVRTYGNVLRAHILPTFGDRAIDEISRQDIQNWMDGYKNCAKSSVQLYRTVLQLVFRLACADGVIQENPAKSEHLKNPATKETKREALTKEQMISIRKSIQELEPVDQCMLALYLTTGMRRGEILGARWDDIDFDRNMVRIERQYNTRTKQIVPPKRGSKGIVPLAMWAKEILLNYRKDDGYILSLRGGSPMSEGGYAYHYKKIKSTINLFGATGHVFRHTAISMVYHDCKDLSNTQGFARHKKMDVTQRYIHPESEKVLAMGRVFDLIMNNDSGAA